MNRVFSVFAFTLFSIGGAQAKDTDACGTDMVCASDPQTVVDALQREGYRAKLDKDNSGDPMISSAATGYNFDIFFYGCEEKKQCDSLQFSVTFDSDKTDTPKLANEWNVGNRFGKAAINDKNQFQLRYDVATIGGLNKTNFKDSLDWWSAVLGDLKVFFQNKIAT